MGTRRARVQVINSTLGSLANTGVGNRVGQLLKIGGGKKMQQIDAGGMTLQWWCFRPCSASGRCASLRGAEPCHQIKSTLYVSSVRRPDPVACAVPGGE